MAETSNPPAEHTADGDRRDFLYLVAGATTAIGAGALIWPLVDSMNPSASVLALASINVDLSGVEPGQRITAKWRGKPVFIWNRTEESVEQARTVDLSELPDPAPDEERVLEPQWLVVIGVCTHLGCVPLGQSGEQVGEFGGWFCPCHGSHYDTSGRIRRGPAPLNLAVPPYEFIDESTIQIG
ncbi:MAG: ubiquinol-cytochrome c reductase iron-sulfur subunit [Geminicoccaceae bacterium]|nr:ubiquinol-cytochrome c reductase iron-sulfur subunit [Geminicoccaceae bacterium]